MIELLPSEGSEMKYRVSGTISSTSLRAYYRALNQRYEAYGKLKLEVEVRSFRGYRNWRALWCFLVNEPQLLWKVCRYDVRSDRAWFRQLVKTLDYFLPHIQCTAAPL